MEELEEFELLEDVADNMSLVSNSSVVARLVTPNKQRQKVGKAPCVFFFPSFSYTVWACPHVHTCTHSVHVSGRVSDGSCKESKG